MKPVLALPAMTCALLLGLSLPADAFVVVLGNELAHDCYLMAKAGINTEDCDRHLQFGAGKCSRSTRMTAPAPLSIAARSRSPWAG